MALAELAVVAFTFVAGQPGSRCDTRIRMDKLWVWGVGAAVLAGCVTQPATSRKADYKVEQVNFTLKNLASDITTRKTTRRSNPSHSPHLTDEQLAEVQQGNRRLDALLQRGFRNEFPRMAAEQGLQVLSDRLVVHTLSVSVVSRHADCKAWRCAVTLTLRGEVLDASRNSIWFFVQDIGQDDFDDPIEPAMFARFGSGFLARMQADGLLAPKAR